MEKQSCLGAVEVRTLRLLTFARNCRRDGSRSGPTCPGCSAADPRVVPSARLLIALHYDEAQELASAGSAVLHPRCISPVRESGIPLFVRCTASPEIAGTVISSVTEEVEPQVKGICIRNGLTLISMDGVGMWHEVGFPCKGLCCL